jgi:hypothetical protein
MKRAVLYTEFPPAIRIPRPRRLICDGWQNNAALKSFMSTQCETDSFWDRLNPNKLE